MPRPEIENASLVMLGAFNPAIFQPRWLGTQQLIRAEEVASAKISIIHTEVADFSTEWFQLQVLQNRLAITSTDPSQYSSIRDLALGILALLPHIPVTALGLNRSFHFRMASREAWHDVGHRLAPKEIWNEILEGPGLRAMIMQGRRKGVGGGTVNIKVEPSKQVENGLFLDFNEEFGPPSEKADTLQWVQDGLVNHWEPVMSFAEASSNELLNMVQIRI